MFRSYFEGFIDMTAGIVDPTVFDPPCTPANIHMRVQESEEEAISVSILLISSILKFFITPNNKIISL